MPWPPWIVPKGPWPTWLDLDLCATSHGEICTPFRHHVRLGREQPCPSDHSFTLFPRLPLELQHHVLSFCDNSTLFRLMHASRSTRKEATKRFWSDPTTRYRIHGGGPWLLSGGFVGTTHRDLEALKYMQYILIEFECTEQTPILHSECVDCEAQWIAFPNEELERSYVEQQIVDFWSILHRCFPCAKDVVLCTESLNDFDEELFRELAQLAEGCSDGINARVSRFRSHSKDRWLSTRPMTRQLWQPFRSDKSKSSVTWELADSSWTPHFVMPPIQKRSGPVGTWLHWVNDGIEIYNYMKNAKGLLFIQAIEAHYLHTLKAPCICPFDNCGQVFEQPGQWAAHYVSSSGHSRVGSRPILDMLQATLSGRGERIKFIGERLDERLGEMRDEWGKEGSDQRYCTTQDFLDQLRDDPLCARQNVPEESRTWREYQIAMNDEWHNY